MQTLIDNGIALVIAFQSLGDWLIAPMRFFSQLGTEEFFFIVLPLIYWSMDAALGIRVGFILSTSTLFNLIGKIAFAGPRPYWVSSHVRALWSETTFGVPSGHAQHAMSVWGIIAAYSKKTWLTIICIVLIVMIGVSRLFLGAHFPHDVLLGWLFGGILVWGYMQYWDSVGDWLSKKSFRAQVGIAALATFVFIMIGMGVVALRANYQIPQSWMDNALLSGTEPDPIDPNSLFTAAGSFFGLALGLAWINSMGGYQTTGPVWKRALRYIIGLIGVLILWQGLGAIFPRGDGFLVYSLRLFRYTLVGAWVSGGAPRLFQHFNLTTSPVKPSPI